jgi:hypothetical protein
LFLGIQFYNEGENLMSDFSNNPQTNRPRPARRMRSSRTGGSLFFPILLISLGIIFLLRNMGALPGDAWDLILRLWPLILIAMGLDNILTRQGVAAPTIFIAVGVVILLDNLNIVQWNVWQVILSLWPVLIIAIGLDLLVARRSIWGAVAALILLAIILGGALWVMALGAPAGTAAESEQVVQALSGAERVVVQVDPAVAALKIGAMQNETNLDALVQGNVQMSNIGAFQQEYNLVGDTGYLNLRREGDSSFSFSLSGSDWVWDLAFNPQIPLELSVNMGAGSVDLDLSGLQVTDVNVQMGVGRTEVVLPDQDGPLTVNIQGAIGEMIVYIPSRYAVHLAANTGLAAISVPDGYIQDGDVYTFGGAGAGSDDRVELNVDQAIGRISIRTR